MDKTIRKIKLFATDDFGNGFVTLLGEFNSIEEISIQASDFAKDVVLSFEEYWIGGEE